jgi:hypothetical protein
MRPSRRRDDESTTTKAALFLVILAVMTVGCGGGDGSSSAPTQAPAATATPLARASAEDPAGDCLSNQGSTSIACDPPALDMRRFTVERAANGDIIATLEITGGGFATLGPYTLLMGIDTDRNATTGNAGYAGFHGLAPEIELAYIVRTVGQPPTMQVRMYGPGGQPSGLADAALVEWRFPDAARVQAVMKPALFANVTSFWIVTDMNVSDRYDHMPDDARLAFPEGQVIRR